MSFTIVTQLESTYGSFENRHLLVVYALKVTYLWSISLGINAKAFIGSRSLKAPESMTSPMLFNIERYCMPASMIVQTGWLASKAKIEFITQLIEAAFCRFLASGDCWPELLLTMDHIMSQLFDEIVDESNRQTITSPMMQFKSDAISLY